MPTSDKAIGIFGGTFDPIHLGHIGVAEHVLSTFSLEKILWVPCNIPAHRNKPKTSAKQRLDMVSLAIQKQPLFEVNDSEINRDGVSYTVDTLKEIRLKHPKKSLFLIIGVDAFVHFNTWKNWQDILSLANLIVINRTGFKLPDSPWLNSLLKKHEVQKNEIDETPSHGFIFFEKMPAVDISATQIRAELANNGITQNTLPTVVHDYINKHKLYR